MCVCVLCVCACACVCVCVKWHWCCHEGICQLHSNEENLCAINNQTVDRTFACHCGPEGLKIAQNIRSIAEVFTPKAYFGLVITSDILRLEVCICLCAFVCVCACMCPCVYDPNLVNILEVDHNW